MRCFLRSGRVDSNRAHRRGGSGLDHAHHARARVDARFVAVRFVAAKGGMACTLDRGCDVVWTVRSELSCKKIELVKRYGGRVGGRLVLEYTNRCDRHALRCGMHVPGRWSLVRLLQ